MSGDNLLSDKALNNNAEDKFQRISFAKQIAQTIINRNDDDPLVIGLYGAWGEGKTTILNFIENELQESNLIVLKFNPWRYSDEETLLKNYFQKIANALEKELKNRLEKAGGLIERFGGIGSIFGVDVSGLGKAVGNVDLEEIKDRVNNFLNESERRLVIVIDDIDRLDKQEIFSVFRLVKLTGDFKKTIFLLSFDENMVSAAIGSRFGEGNKEAGLNFLDKIIQVPLRIPKAQPSALRRYCSNIIDSSLTISNITLDDKEIARFEKEFSNNIFLRLNNPRLAVRYGNALSFSLSILKDEVNTVDLMLLEAIKIFYPPYYSFIRENPNFFIDSYSNNDDRKKEINSVLKEMESNYNDRDSTAIRNLLVELFPHLGNLYALSSFDNSQADYYNWDKNKRIVSKKYFDRYFTYAVTEGEISDVIFNKFLVSIAESSEDDITTQIKDFILTSSDIKFLSKVGGYVNDLELSLALKLATIIAKNSDLFEAYEGSMFGSFFSPRAKAIELIYDIISKEQRKDYRLGIVAELIEVSSDAEFAYELNNQLRRDNSSADKMFTDEQYTDLFNMTLKKVLDSSKNTPFFEVYSNNINLVLYILKNWNIINENEYKNYIFDILDKKPGKVLELIKSVTSTVVSTIRQGAYKASLTPDVYEFLKQTIGEDYLYEKIKVSFGNNLSDEEAFWGDYDIVQTDMNILRQFVFYYNKSKNITTAEE